MKNFQKALQEYNKIHKKMAETRQNNNQLKEKPLLISVTKVACL
jgi:hypothetical protein